MGFPLFSNAFFAWITYIFSASESRTELRSRSSPAHCPVSRLITVCASISAINRAGTGNNHTRTGVHTTHHDNPSLYCCLLTSALIEPDPSWHTPNSRALFENRNTDTAQQHQHQRHRGEPASTTSSSHSLPPPVLVGAHGDSSGGGRVASFPLTGGKIGRSRRGLSSGGSASGSGVIGGGSGGTDGGGGSGSGGVGTGSGRRWRGEGILTPRNLRTRRSLSSGGSKLGGGSTTKKALKGAREGCLSDGEDVEELSPIEREVRFSRFLLFFSLRKVCVKGRGKIEENN